MHIIPFLITLALVLQGTTMLSPTDISSLLYLSDTNIHTLNNIDAQMENIANEGMKRVEDDSWLFKASNVSLFPFFHLFGLRVRRKWMIGAEG
jgi:hypothetical protein